MKIKVHLILRKIIAEELQLQASFKDRVRPLSNKTVKMEVHLTETQYEKLMRVKSQLSHQYPDQKNADIIEHLCDLILKEKKAVKAQSESNSLNSVKILENENLNRGERKANVDVERVVKLNLPNEERTAKKIRSRHVPLAIRKYVMKRANNKCEFTSKEGRRCNIVFQLEVEHVVPFSQGGSHEPNNLKCFCSYHNSYAATQLAIGFEILI